MRLSDEAWASLYPLRSLSHLGLIVNMAGYVSSVFMSLTYIYTLALVA